MLEIFIVVVVFIITFVAARTSHVWGLLAVLFFGYFYGIIRANFLSTFTHLSFDFSVIALYVAQLGKLLYPTKDNTVRNMRFLVACLIIWPVCLFFIPLQDYMIQLVGLRAGIFLLPFILFGSRLTKEDINVLAIGVACLNVIAFLFGATEYFIGIERFYPLNEVTDLIYRSSDIGADRAYRIPAIFTSAHAFAGTMTITLPLIIGGWLHHQKARFINNFMLFAIICSVLGVFMTGVRSHFLVMTIIIMVATLSAEMKPTTKALWVSVLVIVGLVVSGEERLQRFTTLTDFDFVEKRFYSSVNNRLIELLLNYPMGNGLGGGGTSIPYFLQSRLNGTANPEGLENEYSRIFLEEGIIGILLWFIFIIWLLTRGEPHKRDDWFIGRRLAWVACFSYYAFGMIGTGMLTSVPQTAIQLLFSGWVITSASAQMVFYRQKATAVKANTKPRPQWQPNYARIQGEQS